MSKYPLPVDDELAALIRDAMDHAPGPDMRRLQLLEDRLARASLRQSPARRPNTLPWWAVLLLAGGLAAAAWWAGETLRAPEAPAPAPGMSPPPPDTGAGGQSQPGGEAAEGRGAEPGTGVDDTTIIYQREGF